MFLDIDYSSNVLTNTFEQYTIAMNWFTPLQNLTIDEMVEKARELIFDFKYPFYTDEAQAKEDFEKMFILMHLRDNWGVETAGEFKYWLQRKLTLVSDGYRQLYETMKFEYNPIENHNLVRTIERNGTTKDINISDSEVETNNDTNTNTNSNSNSNSNTENKINGTSETTGNRTGDTQQIHSDNPQVNFSGQDYASNMDRGQTKENTATNTNDNTNGTTNFSGTENNETTSTQKSNGTQTINNTQNSNGEFKNNEKYSEHGYLGNVQDAIKKERELIVNINRMLCEEMNDLFLLVLM